MASDLRNSFNRTNWDFVNPAPSVWREVGVGQDNPVLSLSNENSIGVHDPYWFVWLEVMPTADLFCVHPFHADEFVLYFAVGHSKLEHGFHEPHL